MTIYNVHIDREVRLVFEGIEAPSHEAAAAIACDKHSAGADDIDDGDGETFAALVEVAGDEEHESPRSIEFAPSRQRKAASKLLATLSGISEVWSHAEGGSEVMDYLERQLYAIREAIAEATTVCTPPAAPSKKPYSVLLLYPEDVNDSGTETYYAFVEAPDAIEAVAVARREAVAAQEENAENYELNDFATLLLIEGHHFDQHTAND